MSWFDDLTTRYEFVGSVGAVLGWLSSPGDTMRVQAFNLLAGISSAIFVAPFLIEKTQITSNSGKYFLVFMMGLLGMNLISKTIIAARETKVADLQRWVATLIGIKRGGK